MITRKQRKWENKNDHLYQTLIKNYIIVLNRKNSLARNNDINVL